MEFRSDLRLTLKSSCDACTRSKVRCTGEDPCTRCVRKGLQCFYSPKKKRGPAKRKERAALVGNQPVLVSTLVDGNTKGMASLGSHERRSWSVFFTLYKHYAISCSLFWFNRQLYKMQQFLRKQGKTDALKRLSSWMAALNIDEDELAVKVEACTAKIKEWGIEGQAKKDAEAEKAIVMSQDTARHLNAGNPFHLRVNGSIPDVTAFSSTPEAEPLGDFGEDVEDAFLKFSVDYLNPGAEPKVIVNDAFVELMGYGGEEIEKELVKSGGGFLPWGGDVLSRILINESDLLSFVQILAIKFNTLGRPDFYPIVREIPSCHMFQINWRGLKEFGPRQCMVNCRHRERIGNYESSLDVFMSFKPVESVTGIKRNAEMPLNRVSDRDRAVIEDHVELPPKKMRVDDKMFSFEKKNHIEGGKVTARDKTPVIYQYNTVQKDILEATGGENTFTKQDSFTNAAGSVASPAPTLPPRLQSSGSLDMNLGILDMIDTSAKSLDSGASSTVSDSDQQKFILPLKDSNSDEDDDLGFDESIGDEEWLDQLLDWTGPAVPAESSST